MTPLPDPTKPFLSQDPHILLACAVWGESRGESDEGKQAVASVIKNRVGFHGRYGIGFVQVILKPWQFSSFNANDPNRMKLLQPLEHDSQEAWDSCYHIAEECYVGLSSDNTDGATHYFADSIPTPSWAAKMVPTVTIGAHRFFREL